MKHSEISTVSRQLKRTLGERTLNDLGRATRFCRREREVTPFRLAVSPDSQCKCNTRISQYRVKRSELGYS